MTLTHLLITYLKGYWKRTIGYDTRKETTITPPPFLERLGINHTILQRVFTVAHGSVCMLMHSFHTFFKAAKHSSVSVCVCVCVCVCSLS